MGMAGASDRDLWSNTHHCNTDFNLDSQQIADVADKLANAHKTLLINQASVRRVVIKQHGYDFGTLPNTGFRVMEYNLVGQRPIQPNEEVLDITHALVIKRQTRDGRSGRLYLRGLLTNLDVAVDSSGKFVLGNVAPFNEANNGGALNDMTTAAGAGFNMVIPSKANFGTGNVHIISAHRASNATNIKANHRRRAKKGVFDSLVSDVQGRINSVARLILTYGSLASIPLVMMPVYNRLRSEMLAGYNALPEAIRTTLSLPAGTE